MVKLLRTSFAATVFLLIIVSGIYPLVVTAIGQVAFPRNAAGGILLGPDGNAVGMELIGQAFRKARYFHPRPSAAGETGYDAADSSGSNLGPTNQKLYDRVAAEAEAVLRENPPLKRGEIPVDLVTSSASGLDPDISPEAAYVQIDRVAKARKLDPGEVRRLVEKHVQGPQWGIFGESVVNVLLLNRDLDRQFGEK